MNVTINNSTIALEPLQYEDAPGEAPPADGSLAGLDGQTFDDALTLAGALAEVGLALPESPPIGAAPYTISAADQAVTATAKEAEMADDPMTEDPMAPAEGDSTPDDSGYEAATVLALELGDGKTIVVADLDQVADPQALADAVAAGLTSTDVEVMSMNGTTTVTGPAVADARAAALNHNDGVVNWASPDDSVAVVDEAADNDLVPVPVVSISVYDTDGQPTGSAAVGGAEPMEEEEPEEAEPEAEAEITMAADDTVEAAAPATAPWEGILVLEGVESGDGRMILEGALTWRDLPLTLMLMTRNPDGGGGHDGAEVCGTIEWMERRGNEIWGGGNLDMSLPAGVTAQGLLDRKTLRGVSADIDSVKVSYENKMPAGGEISDLLNFDPGLLMVTNGRVMGATLCPFPAFQEAFVYLVPDGQDATAVPENALAATAMISFPDTQVVTYLPVNDDALVADAGAAPVAPPKSWFENPRLTGPTPLTVTADGRVFGHVAAWGTCHIGHRGCTPVPKSKTNYAAFRVGRVLTAEGVQVPTGPIVLNTDHADLNDPWRKAKDFYAHTGCAAADVNIGEDKFGVWVAGAARPDATPSQIRALRASDISPDWRLVNGKPLELVALLVVSNSGFKVPQSLAASAGGGRTVPAGTLAYSMQLGSTHLDALVAAGSVRQALVDHSLAMKVQELAGQVQELMRPIREAKAREKLAALATQRPALVEAPVTAAPSAMAAAKNRMARAQAARLAQTMR